jgi:hypothetical protein
MRRTSLSAGSPAGRVPEGQADLAENLGETAAPVNFKRACVLRFFH